MSAISIIIWFVEIFVFFVEQKLINHRRLWRILETPKMAVLADKLKSITNLFALFVSTNLSFFLQELASSFSMLVHHHDMYNYFLLHLLDYSCVYLSGCSVLEAGRLYPLCLILWLMLAWSVLRILMIVAIFFRLSRKK